MSVVMKATIMTSSDPLRISEDCLVSDISRLARNYVSKFPVAD
jgi:hypothetical protein